MTEVDGHTEGELTKVLENGRLKGVPIVTCSWGVVSVRRRQTKKWANLLMFFDRDTLVPFFIFEFSDNVSLHAMAARLIKTKDFADGVREEFGV